MGNPGAAINQIFSPSIVDVMSNPHKFFQTPADFSPTIHNFCYFFPIRVVFLRPSDTGIIKNARTTTSQPELVESRGANFAKPRRIARRSIKTRIANRQSIMPDTCGVAGMDIGHRKNPYGSDLLPVSLFLSANAVGFRSCTQAFARCKEYT